VQGGVTTVPVLTAGGGWVEAKPKKRPKPAPQRLGALGIASEERVGYPTAVALARPIPAQQLAAVGIASGEALGAVALPRALAVAGIASGEELSPRLLVLRQVDETAELERLRRELDAASTRLSVEWYELAQQLLRSPAGLSAVAELLSRQSAPEAQRQAVARVARVTRVRRSPRAA
jgi:hypothetical protein